MSGTTNPTFTNATVTNSLTVNGVAIGPTFTTSAPGLVPAGTGGSAALFLNQLGNWVAASGGGGGSTPGGSNGQVQYNNSGAFGGLTNAQLTALMNLFTSSLAGSVPASGGGTANFLRADGSWATPPSASVTGLTALSNIAALQAVTSGSLASGPVVVRGYYNPNDGGGGVYDIGSTTTANGGTIINDASGRSWYLQLDGNPCSIKKFGALVNGSTNDTVACQTADTWSRANGSYPILFPAGTTMVTQLTLYTGSCWVGVGRMPPNESNSGAVFPTPGSPPLSQICSISGTNQDVIVGINSYSNWGSVNTPAAAWPSGVFLANLTINGNWQSGTGNTSGNGISYFGEKPILNNVFIYNCAGTGLRTGWIQSDVGATPPGYDLWAMEGVYVNLRIDTCGQHGWWDAGPHDSISWNTEIIDASRSADGTYIAYFQDVGSSGAHFGAHFWTRRSTAGFASVRPYAAAQMGGGGGFFWQTCYFEGAHYPTVITGNNNRCNNCYWTGSTAGSSIIIDGTCSLNKLHGTVQAPASGAAACVGVNLSTPSTISFNEFDLTMVSQELGAISFNGTSAGNNRIRIRAFVGGGATYSGTPAASDDLAITVINNQGTQILDNATHTNGIGSGSAVGLSSGVNVAITSLSLPPGTWMVWGNFSIGNPGGTANVLLAQGGFGFNSTILAPDASINNTQVLYPYPSGLNLGGATTLQAPIGPTVQTFSVATTVYLIGECTFGGSLLGWGSVWARRATP